jgi:hypothetical protein
MPAISPVSSSEKAREPKLLERVREAIRVRHLSLRTEKAYLYWIRQYILFTASGTPRRWESRRSTPS